MEESEEPYAVASVVGSTGTVHVWQSLDGTPRRVLSGSEVPNSSCIESLHSGGHLVSAVRAKGGGTTIVTFDTSRASGGPCARCGAPETVLTCLTSSIDSSFLAAGGKSGNVYLWCYSSGKLLASFDAHLSEVTKLAFTDDAAYLISAGTDGAAHVFSVADLCDLARPRGSAVEPSVTLRAHSLPIVALAVGTGGAAARAITASADRLAQLWHIASGRRAGAVSLPCAPTCAALDQTEDFAYVGLHNGDVLVATVAALSATVPTAYTSLPKLRAPPVNRAKEQPAVTDIALSPSGNDVIVAFTDGFVRIFDAHAQVVLRVYAKHAGTAPVSAVRILYPMPPSLRGTRRDQIATDTARMNHPAIDVSALANAVEAPMLPPVLLAKIECFGGDCDDDNAMDETLVGACSGQGMEEDCGELWKAIDEAVEEEWSRSERVVPIHVDRNVVRRGNDNEREKEKGMKIPPAVTAELKRLRERNRQLEEAGLRIVEMMATVTDSKL